MAGSGKAVVTAPAQVGFFRWLVTSFDKWLFGRGSPVTLGVYRAILCGLICINLLMLAPFFNDWFTENGFVPIDLGFRNLSPTVTAYGVQIPRIDVFALSLNPTVTAILYAGLVLTAALACVGLFSRITVPLLAIGVVSLHHRNPLILHGGDTMMRVCVLYLAFSSCGAAFSLDRWRAVRAGTAPALPVDVLLTPQRLLQIQIAIVYFTTVWHKWGGHFWRDGTAVWYPLHLNEFKRFPLPDFLFSKPIIIASSYGTLLTELALATLVFYKPLRKWSLLAGIAMHAFIEYAFNIPLFAFLMVAAYVNFYDGEEIADWWDKLKRRKTPGPIAMESPESESVHVQV